MPHKIKYKKHLGTKYDTEFKFDNSKWYCSELVWDIYKEQFVVRIGRPRRVFTYNIIGAGKLIKKKAYFTDAESY